MRHLGAATGSFANEQALLDARQSTSTTVSLSTVSFYVGLS